MENNTNFKIVLHAPEIPGNTGSIGRTCVALNLELILIKPYGFDLSEKAVRRAGLDYWKYVQIKEYENWKDFIDNECVSDEKLFFIENNLNNEKRNYFEASFTKNCYIVFGSETKGIPLEILEKNADKIYELPMFSDKIRSLNLSNTVTTVAYECLRKTIYSL